MASGSDTSFATTLLLPGQSDLVAGRQFVEQFRGMLSLMSSTAIVVRIVRSEHQPRLKHGCTADGKHTGLAGFRPTSGEMARWGVRDRGPT